MAKQTELLTDIKVRKINKPGRYPDGAGLYLQVTTSGGKSWLYRYKKDGKTHWKGLGTYGTNNVELSLARERAGNCRRLRSDGIDPIQHFKTKDLQETIERLKGKTFKQCAEEYIEAHKAKWSNEKHRQQWTNTLKTYVYPTIGNLPVEEVDSGLIERVLSPIWYNKNETATRVRQRIEAVLSRAIVLNYREGPNPAVWRGGIEALLPSPKDIHVVTHQPAMKFSEIPTYYKTLREKESVSSLALRFLIQTCVRSKEGRGAHIDEFDLDNKIWTIPADRMKGRKGKTKAHAVPLTDEMISIVNQTEPHRRRGFLFPGTAKNPEITDTSVRKTLLRTHPDLTIHGFRATFRTWAGDKTNYQREVCEACLAHTIESQLEKSYQRGTFFEKRRGLMELWADYCLNGDAVNRTRYLRC